MHVVTVIAVLGLSSPAFAQAPADPAEPNSSAAAVAISVGATLGSLGLSASGSNLAMLGVGGLVVGPSAGRWYNHEVGGIGIAARVVSGILIVRGLARMDTGGCEQWYTAAECAAVEQDERDGARMLELGIGLWAAATLYDIIEAGRGAERYNRERALTVAPTLITSGGRQTTGVAVSLRF